MAVASSWSLSELASSASGVGSSDSTTLVAPCSPSSSLMMSRSDVALLVERAEEDEEIGVRVILGTLILGTLILAIFR